MQCTTDGIKSLLLHDNLENQIKSGRGKLSSRGEMSVTFLSCKQIIAFRHTTVATVFNNQRGLLLF